MRGFSKISHRGISMNTIKKDDLFICHTRLPIQTELGDDYKQPIKICKNRFLLYNGELFNYERDSYENDVEYLIDFFKCFQFYFTTNQLYTMNQWDGFWAIVILDLEKNLMMAFTDPLGKKQLYYDEEFNLCSEINPLVKEKSEYDPLFKSTVLKFGYNLDNRTPYRNIKRVLPGRIYKFDLIEKEIITKKYWGWNFGFNLNKLDLIKLIHNSVKNRLLSKKYPISLLLSGGLDSTIILYHLVSLKCKVDDINIYSIENEEDFKYIKICEKFFDIKVKLINYEINESELGIIFKEFNETPIDLGSVIPQYNLFKQIKDKIVLSGDGADELFGGYHRINEYDSQKSDIFHELSFYHLPRLDRASMRYTIELRNPFLNHLIVRYALNLPYEERKNKKILKEIYKNLIPLEIIERKKEALKNNRIRKNKKEYWYDISKIFYGDKYEDI
jgi:asparagine synthase (glutamine-hydrolysing)